MSDSVGVRELRQQASALLRRVRNGESIEVTDHGRPVARLVPIHPGTLNQLVAEGRAVRGQGALLEVADQLGLPVASTGVKTPSEALSELRTDER